jgi:hypothetical protein
VKEFAAISSVNFSPQAPYEIAACSSTRVFNLSLYVFSFLGANLQLRDKFSLQKHFTFQERCSQYFLGFSGSPKAVPLEMMGNFLLLVMKLG